MHSLIHIDLRIPRNPQLNRTRPMPQTRSRRILLFCHPYIPKVQMLHHHQLPIRPHNKVFPGRKPRERHLRRCVRVFMEEEREAFKNQVSCLLSDFGIEHLGGYLVFLLDDATKPLRTKRDVEDFPA